MMFQTELSERREYIGPPRGFMFLFVLTGGGEDYFIRVSTFPIAN